jgi:hypothetical protein
MVVNAKIRQAPDSGIIIRDPELLQMLRYYQEGNESLAATASRLLSRALIERIGERGAEVGNRLRAEQRSLAGARR